MRLRLPFCTVVAVVCLGLPSVSAHAQGAPETTGTKAIRTLKQIRGEGVVRQRWDVSCGAAALSTVLTYEFDDKTPETAIVVWILHRVNAATVRSRGGFSLLELKRFAEARGYSAEAFSGMSMAELAAQKTPVITPIHSKGVDHFVVVRGIVGDRVVIADPGFGNRTMSSWRFHEVWKNGIVFIVHPPVEQMIVNKKPTAAALLLPDESIISRNIAIQALLPSNPLY